MLSSQCRSLGLVIGANSWGYPLWALLNQSQDPVRIEHINVRNATKNIYYPRGSFSPCMIMSYNYEKALSVLGKDHRITFYQGCFYYKVLANPKISFLVRKDDSLLYL